MIMGARMHSNSYVAILLLIKLFIINIEADTFFKDLRDLCFECDCDLQRLLTESKTQVYFNNISIVCDETFRGGSQDAGFSPERKNSSQEIDFLIEKKIIINNIDLRVENAYPTSINNLMESLNPAIQFHSISLASNFITSVPKGIFIDRVALKELNLSRNEIHSVESAAFRGLKELKRIYLNDNLLKNFDFDGFEDSESLEEVNLSKNAIKSMNCQNLTFSHLRSLDLSSNFLFGDVSSFCDSKFPQLRYLNLSNNQIDKVHEGAFDSLRELRLLDLSHNRLLYFSFDILKELKNLELLLLQNNEIETVFGVLTDSSHHINSTKNSVGNTEKVGSNSLVSLNIGFNKIKDVKYLSTFAPKLQELDVSWNLIQSVSSAGTFKSLRRLILDGNPLDYLKLNLSNFVSLEFLSLSEVMDLKVFYASNVAGIFANQSSPKCSTLKISHNSNLRAIVGNFSGTNICKFDLSFNQLTYIDKNMFNWEKLKSINFQGNPLICICEQRWMVDDLVPFLMRADPSLLADLRCDEPGLYRGKRLVHWYNRSSDFCDPSKSLDMSNSRVGTTASYFKTAEITSDYKTFFAFGIVVAIITVMLAIGYFLFKKQETNRSKQQMKRNRRYPPSNGGVI